MLIYNGTHPFIKPFKVLLQVFKRYQARARHAGFFLKLMERRLFILKRCGKLFYALLVLCYGCFFFFAAGIHLLQLLLKGNGVIADFLKPDLTAILF